LLVGKRKDVVVIAAVSSSTFIPGLILGIVIGIALMRAATGFRQRFGRTPWGMPPWAWLLVGLILGVIGAALYLIAHATTKKSLSRYSGSPPPYGTAYPPPPVPPPSPQAWAPPSVDPAPQAGDSNPPSAPEQATPPPQ
jgi:F0F1-type ATP synthase assembly protein I